MEDNVMTTVSFEIKRLIKTEMVSEDTIFKIVHRDYTSYEPVEELLVSTDN